MGEVEQAALVVPPILASNLKPVAQADGNPGRHGDIVNHKQGVSRAQANDKTLVQDPPAVVFQNSDDLTLGRQEDARAAKAEGLLGGEAGPDRGRARGEARS